jgi:hypothetical protein
MRSLLLINVLWMMLTPLSGLTQVSQSNQHLYSLVARDLFELYEDYVITNFDSEKFKQNFEATLRVHQKLARKSKINIEDVGEFGLSEVKEEILSLIESQAATHYRLKRELAEYAALELSYCKGQKGKLSEDCLDKLRALVLFKLKDVYLDKILGHIGTHLDNFFGNNLAAKKSSEKELIDLASNYIDNIKHLRDSVRENVICYIFLFDCSQAVPEIDLLP